MALDACSDDINRGQHHCILSHSLLFHPHHHNATGWKCHQKKRFWRRARKVLFLVLASHALSLLILLVIFLPFTFFLLGLNTSLLPSPLTSRVSPNITTTFFKENLDRMSPFFLKLVLVAIEALYGSLKWLSMIAIYSDNQHELCHKIVIVNVVVVAYCGCGF